MKFLILWFLLCPLSFQGQEDYGSLSALEKLEKLDNERWQTIKTTTSLLVCQTLDQFGNRRTKHGKISTGRISEIVNYCFDAAQFNPAAGSRFTSGIKLISIIYRESGFDAKAVNTHHNKNKSIDYGLAQINNVHLKGDPSTFTTFKVYIAEVFKPKDIFDIRTNIYFAAWLNEAHLSKNKKLYNHHDRKRKDQLKLWNCLAHDLPKILAAQGIENLD